MNDGTKEQGYGNSRNRAPMLRDLPKKKRQQHPNSKKNNNGGGRGGKVVVTNNYCKKSNRCELHRPLFLM